MDKKNRIVADDKIPFLKGVLEPYANVEYYPGIEITKEILQDADALCTRTRTKCNAELLEGSSIKIITTATIGIDHIDTDYCDRNRIEWTNAPGCNSSSVQQYISSALFVLAKKYNFQLSDMTIGIVGVGNVGSKIEHLARALGMNVLINDPPRARLEENKKFVSLDEISERSDIITFHVPLKKEGEDKTYHLADDSFFNKLKKTAIIINSSRGPVIETNALKNAIKKKKLLAVVLDVWENEPNIDIEVLEMVDIATPHIAGYSADGKANGTAVCVNSISEFFDLKIGKHWYPTSIPLPDRSTFLHVNCEGKSEQEVLSEILINTYDILTDHDRLINSPVSFENQRNNYPVRREFPHYTINLKKDEENIVNILQKLGFKVCRL